MIRCVLGDSCSPPRRGGYTWVARLGIGRSSCKFCLDSILSQNNVHCCYSPESTSALSRASKHGKETISQLGCVKVSQMLTELFPSWKNVSVFLRFFFFFKMSFSSCKIAPCSGTLSQMASSLPPALAGSLLLFFAKNSEVNCVK